MNIDDNSSDQSSQKSQSDLQDQNSTNNPLQQFNMENKMRRRSKKDKTGRNFVCGCGKQYLSYPALYTHIKTKHQGDQPEGTKAFTNNKTKRGRPKKHENNRNQDQSDLNSLIGNNEPIIKNTEFINILIADYVLKEDLKSLEYVQNILGNIGIQGRSDPLKFLNNPTLKYQTHPFQNIIKQLQDQDMQLEETLSKLTCDICFCLFLYNISKFLNESAFRIYVIFFKNLRICLNLKGYELSHDYKIKHNFKTMDQSVNGVFTEVESPEYVPLVKFIPLVQKSFDQKLLVLMFKDFCQWLVNKELTDIKLNLDVSNMSEHYSLVRYRKIQ